MIHFGTAGWLYKDWEGIVYPEDRPKGFDPLHFLARFFSTVEVNSTYYGPARPETADKWIARVSDFPDFRFTAKLWKRFTHERGSAWTRAGIGFVNIDQPLIHNSISVDQGGQAVLSDSATWVSDLRASPNNMRVLSS